MIFSSTLFLFIFLPAVLLAYHIIPQKLLTAKNILLLFASLIFYGWGEPRVILLMLYSILMNYLFGILIHNLKENNFEPVYQRLALAATVIFNIYLLGYYKYFNFLTENLNWIFKTNIKSNIALPIGISFFTFQIMSYVIDVYRGKVKFQKNIFNLALYISFFPQLIAGPIVRYIDIEKQLENRKSNINNIASGMQRFIIGLSKKVLIANQVSVFADRAFNASSPASVMAWIGAICYALQIYFDFSGYSDMAIGMGKMFGFEFLENFDYPYISNTVQNFWRRWHISLSSWFRDYLYIPLGGNRKGVFRTYINLLIVFTVTGLWHGASWSFVVWGLYHGVFLMLERGAWGKILRKLPRAVTWVYTMFVVLIGWVIFRAETLGKALEYIKCMFNFSTGGLNTVLASLNIIILIAILSGMLFSAPILPFIKKELFGEEKNHFECEDLSPLKQAASWVSIAGCIAILILSVIFLTGSDFNPFLYFRF
ncbi:MAG: MBOAT family protein [Oscillospiraceae bacterium]|nr:MBOAT family protein [Oscillospiraceae bacterium]